jgi:hypothetical protein
VVLALTTRLYRVPSDPANHGYSECIQTVHVTDFQAPVSNTVDSMPVPAILTPVLTDACDSDLLVYLCEERQRRLPQRLLHSHLDCC